MSLALIKSDHLETKAWANNVDVGRYTIDMDDFCQLVWYVLTNSDLVDNNDSRATLIDMIRNGHYIKGYDPSKVRFEGRD